MYEEITLTGGAVLRGWYDETTGVLRMGAGSMQVPAAKIVSRTAVAPPAAPVEVTQPQPVQSGSPAPPAAPPAAGSVVSLTPMNSARLQELAAEKAAKENKDAETKRLELEQAYRDVWGVAYQIHMDGTGRAPAFPDCMRGKLIPIGWRPGEPKVTEFRPNTAISETIGETVIEKKGRTTVYDHLRQDDLGRIHIVEGDKEMANHTVYGKTNEPSIVAVWRWLDVNGDRRGIELGPSFYRVVR